MARKYQIFFKILCYKLKSGKAFTDYNFVNEEWGQS